jgi:hypothetical protein
LPDNGVDAHAMAAGDVNGDGLGDILIGNWFGGGFPPLMLLQQPDGRFTAANDPLLERLLSVPMVNPKSVGNDGFNLLLDLHLVDVNGDRFADLIAGFGHGSTPSLLFINKNGRFNFDERIALPPSIYGIDTNLHLETKSADLDNDGDLDLLIQHSRYVPYYGGNYLQLLRNDQGTFTDITSLALPQDEEFLARRHLQIVDLDEKAAIIWESLEGHNQHMWDLVGVEELQALCVEDIAVRWFLRANHRVVLEDHLAPLFRDDLLEADQAYSGLEALVNLDLHLEGLAHLLVAVIGIDQLDIRFKF